MPAHNHVIQEKFHLMYQVARLPWPPFSPDLNPIEKVWAIIKNRIRKRRVRPKTMGQLKQVWQEEWVNLSIEEINEQIIKMPLRMKQVIEAKGSNNFHA